ncbi:UdgX family uracil-DNA binding protein [Saccharomonospora xinjiangensis]|uniref:UdgX family uracil-DNA binding protein n=1 Tax=Saccharomonospora xinjiangensis TaxID=75294 RepID=UPI00106F5538|nr:UdgX family uracil-DNA binding protein [Saccharomonospora xinjiangensis]QBQ59775.1 Uracil DNA glycosylase superfamily protein [Saccharomonospora xinjiangensis]
MVAYEGAQRFLPRERGLTALREASAGCRGCDLYAEATQTVFGEGPVRARLVMVGEVPGDREDREGRPFVGPAGGLLDRALADAGIDRDDVYVTNAVKHFRFTRDDRASRRIHKKPSRSQIVACRPWLLAELDTIKPDVVVALGATAAQSLFGKDFRVSSRRGEVLELPGPPDLPLAVATVHPSAVLRARDSERDSAYAGLVADLAVVAKAASRRTAR